MKRQRSTREGRENLPAPPAKETRQDPDHADFRSRDSQRGKAVWDALTERRSSGLSRSKRREEYWKGWEGGEGEDLEEGELDLRPAKRSKKRSIFERLGGNGGAVGRWGVGCAVRGMGCGVIMQDPAWNGMH